LFFATVSLLLVALVFGGVHVPAVKANVPSIMSIGSHEVGSTIWLDIVVSHQPPTAIGALHYVPVVQLEINGTTADLTQEPQSTETFTVQYSLGSNSNTYSVRARALCNLHGYSAWSGTVVVPTPTPIPTPTPVPTSTPTPSISPNPSPTASPSQSPTPSASSTPSPEPTTTPTGLSLPPEVLYVIAATGIAFLAVITVVALKRKKK